MVKIEIFVECINSEAEPVLKESYYEDLSIKETIAFKFRKVQFEKKILSKDPFIFQLIINHPFSKSFDEKNLREAIKQAVTKEIVKKGIYDTDFLLKVNIDG